MGKLVFLVCFLLILAVVLAYVLHIYHVSQSNRMMRLYMETLENNLAVMQEKADKIRKYRHDLMKHIQVLENMRRNQEEVTDLVCILKDMKTGIGNMGFPRICDDEIVHTICEIKRKQCVEKEIPFVLQIENKDYGSVRAVDMAAVLFNLLENAIEVNERIADKNKRGIWLFMGKDCNFININVENILPENEQVDFTSKKKMKEDHGFGMKIIRDVVERYEGSIDIKPGNKKNSLCITARLGMERQ